ARSWNGISRSGCGHASIRWPSFTGLPIGLQNTIRHCTWIDRSTPQPFFSLSTIVAVVGRAEIAVTGRDQVRGDIGQRLAQPAAARLQLDPANLASRTEEHQIGNPAVTPILFNLAAVIWSRFLA